MEQVKNNRKVGEGGGESICLVRINVAILDVLMVKHGVEQVGGDPILAILNASMVIQ